MKFQFLMWIIWADIKKFLTHKHEIWKDFKGNLMKRKTLMVPWHLMVQDESLMVPWHLMVQDETLMGPGWLSPPDDGPGGVEQLDDGYRRSSHWWSDRST